MSRNSVLEPPSERPGHTGGIASRRSRRAELLVLCARIGFNP